MALQAVVFTPKALPQEPRVRYATLGGLNTNFPTPQALKNVPAKIVFNLFEVDCRDAGRTQGRTAHPG